MTKPLLPPRGIFAATRLLFHHRLAAPVKETALQLMALSWHDAQHCTPPLTLAELARLTGKDERTLRGHMQALVQENAIEEKRYLEPGRFILRLSAWLFNNGAGRRGAVSGADGVAAAKEEYSHSQEDGLAVNGVNAASERPSQPGGVPGSDRPPAGGGNHAGGAPYREAPQPGEARALPRLLSRGLQQELLAFGVFPALLNEVAGSPYSEADLRALLAWCRIDAPDSAAGLFIGRMRAGARAPKAYHGKPCDVCGLYGAHKPDCRRRYAQDIYLTH